MILSSHMLVLRLFVQCPCCWYIVTDHSGLDTSLLTILVIWPSNLGLHAKVALILIYSSCETVANGKLQVYLPLEHFERTKLLTCTGRHRWVREYVESKITLCVQHCQRPYVTNITIVLELTHVNWYHRGTMEGCKSWASSSQDSVTVHDLLDVPDASCTPILNHIKSLA